MATLDATPDKVAVYRTERSGEAGLGSIELNQTQADMVSGRKPWLKLTRFGSIEMSRLIGETPRGAKLLSALFAAMDDDNTIVATLETLAELSEMSARTVQRAIGDLTDRTLLEVLQIQKRGTAHVYRINERVIWSGRGPKARAVVNARVLLRGDDQARPELVGTPQPSLPEIDPKALKAAHEVYQPPGGRDPHLTLDQADLETLMQSSGEE